MGSGPPSWARVADGQECFPRNYITLRNAAAPRLLQRKVCVPGVCVCWGRGLRLSPGERRDAPV